MAGIVVVGAGPGLGSAVACRFAREGLPVGLIARRRAAIRAVRRALDREAAEVLAYLADVADARALRFALQGVVDKFGVPDAVVYDDSLTHWERKTELPVVTRRRHRALNVMGVVTTAAEVLPLMADRGQGTFLVTGDLPDPSQALLSRSPGWAELRALADILSSDCAPVGVHVAAITICGRVAPGTNLAPESIADYYWRIFREQPEQWRSQYNCTGSAGRGRDDAGFVSLDVNH
jgi:NADP-dependent 3-hydroxy acid dehydrogenase YdfG